MLPVAEGGRTKAGVERLITLRRPGAAEIWKHDASVR